MYVTRPLSLYKKAPSALAIDPQDREGPYSGYLVITDEEAEAANKSCWGLFKKTRVKKLPFPQDKILRAGVFDSISTSEYEDHPVVSKRVWFVPVLDQPLSSNCYYVIKAKGKHKGLAYACSRDMVMGLCCFTSVIREKKPKPLDPRNIYQEFKIHRYLENSFFAKSLPPDGFPPKFLRQKGWQLRISRKNTKSYCKSNSLLLSDALGLDASLRSQLPSFNFPSMKRTSNRVVVGRWYCPFMFVREHGVGTKEQMKRSLIYEMTLEQYWEKIYSCDNINNEGHYSNFVNVNVDVQRQVNMIHGIEAKRDGIISHGGIIWYRPIMGSNRVVTTNEVFKVGLSFVIVEKMKWILENGGWVGGEIERSVKVERAVEMNACDWRRFHCYVLVECFALRRMDKILVMTFAYRHTNSIKCKWE